jgi:hypothetical protein
MWAYLYFPSIAPELHPTLVPWSYGKVWMDAKYPEEVPSYPTCFKLFSDPSKKRSPEEFTTFKAKKYGSEDFKEFSNQGFFRGNATWGAYLYSRDLVVIRATNAGVKAKLPCYQQRTLSFAGSKAIWLVPIVTCSPDLD